MIARESDIETHIAVDEHCSPMSSFSSSFTYVKEESYSGLESEVGPENDQPRGALWPEDPEA